MTDGYSDSIPRETRKPSYLQSFDRQKLDSADPADFASKLLSFVRQNKVAADALVAGNIQMLGFETLRERFGERWHTIKDKVHLLTESTIKKHISADDVFCLVNDDTFIVLFGKADKTEGGKVAGAIGKEVNAKLSGAGVGSDAVSVKPVVFEVPRNDPPPSKPAQLEKTVEEAQREAEAQEAAKIEAAQETLRLKFWPVANVRKRLVSCYQAELFAPDGVELDIDEPSQTGAAEAAIDRLVLHRAGAALVDAAAERRRAFLIVPVHFDTLAVKGFRDRYLEICRILPRLAETRLVLMVAGLEDGVPQGRLHGIFTYLAPYVAGFIGQFGFSFRRGDKLGGLKMVGIGVEGAGMAEPGGSEFDAMKGFVAGNGSAKMRRYFFNAASFDAATMARRARFDYVEGAGVAPAMPVHGKVFNL